MAGKTKKQGGDKPKKSGKAKAEKAKGKSAKPKSVNDKVKTAAKPAAEKVKSLAKAAAANPVLAEVVAATLVAAAAAIRDPAKARHIAAAAGDELKALTKGSAKGGEAMWQLAMDVAGKSIAAFGAGQGGAASKAKKGTKGTE